jgi:uncharacterized ferredoxin-like protein
MLSFSRLSKEKNRRITFKELLMDHIQKSVYDIAGYMMVAAKTAPKAKGQDNLVFKLFTQEELGDLADKMVETGKSTMRSHTFNRDAECVRKSMCLLMIGSLAQTLKLDCGFCGVETCSEAEKNNITCAYNSGDLGIAMGSAVATAARFHVDNRILYTAGYTAKLNNLFEQEVRMALGIPLSATGKNPFFDR